MIEKIDMKTIPHARIALEQWRALVAVVDAGGYAQAAEALHKSQSSVSYAVQRIEELLDVAVFRKEGRRSVLTAAGQVLYRRARLLLDEAGRVERVAHGLAQGAPSELRLAIEIIFPTWLLLQCMQRFGEHYPDTRIELHESVLGGTTELMLQGHVDLAIGSMIPTGFAGDPLLPVRFVCCAAPDHPLHHVDGELTLDDLKRHRHLLVRDTGSRRDARVSALDAEQRWTMGTKATSIRAACMGQGFAWFAEASVRAELERGELKVLPLRNGAVRWATLYLIHPDPDAAGPGAVSFAALLREAVAGLGDRSDPVAGRVPVGPGT